MRDVSYQTRSEQGTKIKDTFMSINQTAKKLGVSFYDYVYDRVAGHFKLPSLADLIAQKAQALRFEFGFSLEFKVDTAKRSAQKPGLS